MASFDSAHNFPGGNANLPAGTTPSLTSADNEEQTPVLDSPRSLWDEAIGNTRRRRWSGSNLTTTDSDARESPSNERLLPPLRSLPPAYPPPTTFTRTALSMSPHDTSRRTGYPFSRGRRPDISSYGGRSQYTRSLLDDSPPLEASLERSFGRLPTRYGRIYRHRSHDLLDDPLFGGGIDHVINCFGEYLRHDSRQDEKLISYAERLGNGAVFKRLGFLAERMSDCTYLVDACKKRMTKGNAKIAPTFPCPRLVTRWRLWVPEREFQYERDGY